jgi:ribosomal protein S18 acetylase RimI-like enzyme
MTCEPPCHQTPAVSMCPNESLSVEVRPYDHPHAVSLVQALFDEQADRYGYADPANADPSLFAPPIGLFLVGYLSGNPVSCGGYRRHKQAPRTVEIKKMFTLANFRGLGYGGKILGELERRAVSNGADHALLETGTQNDLALALYIGSGYSRTSSYVPGRDPRINRAFIKTLNSDRHALISRR